MTFKVKNLKTNKIEKYSEKDVYGVKEGQKIMFSDGNEIRFGTVLLPQRDAHSPFITVKADDGEIGDVHINHIIASKKK